MTNAQIPSYSGVTINISNPTVNALPYQNSGVQSQAVSQPAITVTNPIPERIASSAVDKNPIQQAYPAEYYMNNYNTVNNNPVVSEPALSTAQPAAAVSQTPDSGAENQVKEEDLSASTNIINSLDEKAAKQKELEENGKQTRVVALTDEYIMSLENYLNNQNTDIRLMAAKEVLTRLDEDKTRFDDAALNALLNKMLQDPQKIIRTAALSAFSSGLASGNDYTVQLLNNIQQNPNSDKEDVVEAANILLKMSAKTEVRYTPAQNNSQPAEEQKAE